MTDEATAPHEATRPAATALEYSPTEHTAAVINDEAIYVVDLRDSRVLRLTGLAALAWERASGLVSPQELEVLIAEADVDPEHIASSIRETEEALLEQGLLEPVPPLSPRVPGDLAEP